MSLIPVICSRCGASLSVDDKKTTAICEYCRTPFSIESALSPNSNTASQIPTIIKDPSELPEFEIVGGVLKGYYGLNSEVVVPEGVVEISTIAFNYVWSDPTWPNYLLLVESITLPNTVKRIGTAGYKPWSAFGMCYHLRRINIPDSVEYITPGVFSQQINLEEVNISDDHLLRFGWKMIENCFNVTLVRGDPMTPASSALTEQLKRASKELGICWKCQAPLSLKRSGKCRYCGAATSFK